MAVFYDLIDCLAKNGNLLWGHDIKTRNLGVELNKNGLRSVNLIFLLFCMGINIAFYVDVHKLVFSLQRC